MSKLVKTISGSIKKKTYSFLKSATIIFFLILSLVDIYMLFIINEQVEVNKNFYNNSNTHIIKTRYKRNENDVVALENNDIQNIKEMINSSKFREECIVAGKYDISYGINSEDSSYFICAYDDVFYEKIGLEIGNNEAYSMDIIKQEKIELDVPIISFEDGGSAAYEYKKLEIGVKPITNKNLSYFNKNQNIIYVNKDTYNTINSIINTNVVYKDDLKEIVIYVNEFDDVKSIAEDIDELGYNVEYTLDAFENLSKSLKDSKVIGLFVLLCVLLIAIVNIILSSENYLRTSQKDMGILLHYGYDRKVVKKIYLNNFIGIFVRIAIGVFILNILVSSIFVRQNLLANCTIICFIIAVILFVVFIIVRQRLYRYLEKDILDLIKFSKEIE